MWMLPKVKREYHVIWNIQRQIKNEKRDHIELQAILLSQYGVLLQTEEQNDLDDQ